MADDILKNVEYDALRIVFNKFQSVVAFLPTTATVLSPEVMGMLHFNKCELFILFARPCSANVTVIPLCLSRFWKERLNLVEGLVSSTLMKLKVVTQSQKYCRI